MTIAKYLLLVFLGLLPLSGRAAEMFESPEHYSVFSVSLSLQGLGRDTVNMNINLPPRHDPGPHGDGMLNLSHHNRHQAEQPLNKKQAQAIPRLIAAALAGYRLPPTTLATPGKVAEKLTITVSGGTLNSGTFCFIRADAAQWKKAVDSWNAIRAILPPAIAGDVPAL